MAATSTGIVNIKVDTKTFEKSIKTFREDMPKIAKLLMAYVFSLMRIDIRRNIKSNFKRRKGWLLKDVNYWAFDDFSGAIFTRNSKRQGVNYASLLENGATITPKKGKYLFIYQGRNISLEDAGITKKMKRREREAAMIQYYSKTRAILKKVESVTIPARPFFGPVVNDYWGGGGYKAARIMEKKLQDYIDYYINKKGKSQLWKPPANKDD